ncbi:MAG: N-acetylmuramoyl-L-alanine amidase [Promethearchaeota archaeon]
MYYDLSYLNKVKKDLTEDNDILFLDFGHGGKDSGCVFYDKSYEKNYNLMFGKKVMALLKPYFEQFYVSRVTDSYVSLRDRTDKMNYLASKNRSVQAFSFHCNASVKHNSRGVEWLLSQSNTDDTEFCKNFLSDYCLKFGLYNRGIVRRKGSSGKDYYYLHSKTSGNCKVKYLELFFGDNREDLKIGKTAKFKDEAAFMVAQYILKRYGKEIKKPENKSINYVVQVGAFNSYDNAVNLQKKLQSKGFSSYIKKV